MIEATEKHQQMRNGVLYFLPVIFSILVPLITLPLFTRFLTPSDYGLLALVNIWALLASGVSKFGLNSAYDRNFFKYRTDKQATAKLLYSVIIFTLLSSLVFILGTYIFELEIAKLLSLDVGNAHLITVSLCAVAFTGINVYFMNYFRNSENAKPYVFFSIATSLLNAAIGIYYVVILKVGVIGLIYGQLFSAILIFILASIKILRELPFNLDAGLIREALKVGYPLTPNSIIGVLNQNFDKYMINLLGTISGVGIYSVAQNISYIVFVFITTIQNIFSPRVYREMFDNSETGGKVIGRYLTPFVYISFLPCVLLGLLSEEVIFLLLPEPYQGASIIISILVMYYGLLFFGKVVPAQLMYAKKSGVLSWILLLAVVLNVGVNIPFILLWGAVGAAWATLIASLISGGVALLIAQKYYRIQWEWLKLLAILILFFAIIITSITLSSLEVDYSVRLLVKLIGIGGFVYLGVKIGVLSRKNMLDLKAALLPASR